MRKRNSSLSVDLCDPSPPGFSKSFLVLPPINHSTVWSYVKSLYSQVLIHMTMGILCLSHSLIHSFTPHSLLIHSSVPGTMLAYSRYSRNICWRKEWMNVHLHWWLMLKESKPKADLKILKKNFTWIFSILNFSFISRKINS